MTFFSRTLAAGFLLAATASSADAITIAFSCIGDQGTTACTQGGSGGSTTSAILDFKQVDADTLQVVVDNTSPEDFAPALLSFGFFVDPDGSGLLDFTAFADDGTGTLTDIVPFWTVNQGSQGLFADFVADNGNGVQDGLYNPDVIGRPAQSLIGNTNPFFTTATFTFNFDQPVSLVLQDVAVGSGLTGSTFVRFQKVGPNAKGGTKIACTTSDPACTPGGPNPVPEPGMIGLLGGGLLCVAFLVRRRRIVE